jgi:putative DNA primase/helicase
MSGSIDFEGIKKAALCNGRPLLQKLIPGGKFRSLEYIALNPRRDDKSLGSFKINYRSGVWKDFATGDGGGDLVSLLAYLRDLDQGVAARELADMLGVPFLKTNGHAKPNDLNGRSHDGSAPKVHQWGEDGPARQGNEIRRHYYPSDGSPKRKAKIKSKSEPKDNWVTWYRVFRNGVPIGWQAKKPDDYVATPYNTTGLNPFDPELKDDKILWPEGEKDVETLGRLNLPSFTFGGVGDGLPDGIGHHLKHRRLVILADNDEGGRDHAEKKAGIAHEAGAASIRIIYFPELAEKQDVSNFITNGGTAGELIARIDAAPLWLPPAVSQEPSNEPGLVICRASEIAPEPVSWLWPGRIAVGKQTLIAGEPGLGKSQLATAIIAAVTTSGYWPNSEGRAPLGRAIILSSEDGIADTIVPRLIVAGADLSRVEIISAVCNEEGNRRSFNLQADLSLLEAHIKANSDVRIIVTDPLSSYMGAIDSHKNTDVRSVLETIGEMAARHHVAILGITHFSKGAGQRAINAFIGSVAFIAAARSAFAVMKDPGDETRRLFLPVKNNLAPLGHGLAFRLSQRLVATATGQTVASAVSWDNTPVTNTADEVMAANTASDTPRTAKADCVDFLQSLLSAGWMEVGDVAAEAISAGLHSEGKQLKDNKPMREARAALKVETKREGFGKGARYFWALPGTPWAPSDPIGAPSNNRAPMDPKGAHEAPEETDGR